MSNTSYGTFGQERCKNTIIVASTAFLYLATIFGLHCQRPNFEELLFLNMPDSPDSDRGRNETAYSLLHMIALKQDVEDLLGCPVDVVTEAALSPYIREQILAEEIRL